MKRLSPERSKILFEKLAKYIGPNVKHLIDRPDGTYCFREYKNRVYYVSEEILNLALTIPPKKLVMAGTLFGQFTKSNKFLIRITALVYLAPYARYKIWVKQSSEQQYLYGNHITKSGLGRITENTPANQGVVVYNMADLPLGLGTAMKATVDCKHADPMAIICVNQSDIGEYIRSEEKLVHC